MLNDECGTLNRGTRLRAALTFIIHYSAFSIILLLSGCQLIGVLAYKIGGPAAIPAKYVPAKKPLLVLVENYRNQSSVQAQADLLARHLYQQLDVNNVAPLVSLEKLEAFRDAHPTDLASFSVASIAKAVGAEQVMYVQLQTSDVNPISGGEGFSGQTTALVKVIDAQNGATLWPADIEQGQPVSAAANIGASNGRDPSAVRQRMYIQLSDNIAKLFYKWKPDDDRPEGLSE